MKLHNVNPPNFEYRFESLHLPSEARRSRTCSIPRLPKQKPPIQVVFVLVARGGIEPPSSP